MTTAAHVVVLHLAMNFLDVVYDGTNYYNYCQYYKYYLMQKSVILVLCAHQCAGPSR